MIDPDHREAAERAQLRGARPRAAVVVESLAGEKAGHRSQECRAFLGWYGPGPHPRTSPGKWTPLLLARADAMARAAMCADPGQLYRTRQGAVYVYRWGPVPSHVEVV